MIQDEIKRSLGKKAATLVEEGMLVGLGSGTTATCFIQSLIERYREGLKCTAVSSSVASANLARQGGIPVLEMDEVTSIDLTVDGADEVDPRFQMIKGGGAAHVREKILASSSKQWVVIIDESKLVKTLGKAKLPVEILSFGYRATIAKIEQAGYRGELRKKGSSMVITDNGNYLYDITTPALFFNPRVDHFRLIALPGVIDTGFFFDLPARVLVGYKDGTLAYLKEGN